LETLATLAGFTAPLVLAWRLRPDVARVCPRSGAAFLGGAKDTETPGCEATRSRLRWYALGSRTVCAGRPLTIALAAAAGAEPDWHVVLRQVARQAGLVPVAQGTAELGDTIILTARLSGLGVVPGDVPNAVNGRLVAEGAVGASLVVVAHPVWQ
jgi:hypothetical protein